MEKEIVLMKKQINNAYDVDNVLAMENELAHNKQIINTLMSQNKGLVNVKKGQNKAMKSLNHDNDANTRLENIKVPFISDYLRRKCSITKKKPEIR